MARKQVERKRARVLVREEAELRADLQRLREATKDCYSSECWCHREQWDEIATIRFLLGEDPTI